MLLVRVAYDNFQYLSTPTELEVLALTMPSSVAMVGKAIVCLANDVTVDLNNWPFY